ATIREQATEGILSRDSAQLTGAAKEFEQLNGRYTSMLDNHLIPSQYKLSFLRELDLEKVVIDLRNLAENPANDDLILKTISQLRQINKQFLQFDRIVVNEMRNRVMQYQKRGLVLMGLIIFLTCSTLVTLYLKSVKPLIDLAAQAEKSLPDGKPLQLEDEKKSSVEVRTLVTSVNQLLQKPKEASASNLTHHRREAEFSAIVNEVTNRLNGIINYSQLLADYCETENVADEQRQILYKIIENGEKSAEILQKGLHGGDV
ncbi:MAG: hypothetical protein KKA76_13915, partial [Proteobacteria bacterium]|nr:hypothetical protein [Pseudomonadota bacterium]